MPGPVIRDPTPEYLKAQNASVLDTPVHRAIRALAHLIGADDPQSQALMLMTPMDVGPNGGLAGLVQDAIRAYHGSPHSFDQFSTAKIGTGEGAQAYGHGLYFAENEGTARAYRDNFQSFKDAAVQTTGGERLNVPTWVQNRMDAGQVDSVIADFSDRLKEMLDKKASSSQPWLVDEQIQNTERILKASHAFKAGQATTIPAAHMYEVNIHAKPEQLLDWDKPLSEQSPQVQAAIQQMREAGVVGDEAGLTGPTATGGQFLKSKGVLAPEHNLKRFGVPGVQYLDQGSRAAGEGSRNYVIFDDSIIDILKKYGIALGAAAHQALPQSRQQEGQ